MTRGTTIRTRGSTLTGLLLSTGLLQPEYSSGNHMVAGKECKCDDCKRVELNIQRSPFSYHNSRNESEGHVPHIVYDVLNSPGQPLDAETRAFFEPRFGQDFSQVRVHSDEKAAESAKSVNALAYTVGNSVVFEKRYYQPTTNEGKKILAHELVHVLQQKFNYPGFPVYQTDAHSPVETQAETIANSVLHNRLATIVHKSPIQIARQQSPTDRKVKAFTEFQRNNLSNLGLGEIAQIGSSVERVTQSNDDLLIAFYDHYSSHNLRRMTTSEEKEAKANQWEMLTTDSKNTGIRSDVNLTVASPRLGTMLLHEMLHGRHPTASGLNTYLEGDTWGMELFFSYRSGAADRVKDLDKNSKNMASKEGKAFIYLFCPAYATMKFLYEVIDSNGSSAPRDPQFSSLTADKARKLVTEFFTEKESSHSTELKSIRTWLLQGSNIDLLLADPAKNVAEFLWTNKGIYR